MNISFWIDKWWNEILINKKGYLLNLFTMIDNWYFESKFNKKVINIVKKTNEELLNMWFTLEDINEIRLQTSEEVLIKNWFTMKDLCIFDISKDRGKFVVKIMNLLENWKESEVKDYICKISNYVKLELWLKMSDLDLIEGSNERWKKIYLK